jgi:hypothetical protein
MKRSVAVRGVERGLAKVEPTTPNTLVAYAAKAGSTASDGDGANSPFTAALIRYLLRPGLDVRKAFGFARDEVLKVTNNRQEPFMYGSLGGEDFILVPAPAQPDPAQAIRHDYELAERVGTLEAWDFFLSTYPEGLYAKLAQAQRNKLLAERARIAAAGKAREAEQERARLAAESVRADAEAKAAAEVRAAEVGHKAAEAAKRAEAERTQSKAAEDARHADEKSTRQEEAKAADAERARLTEQLKAGERARIAAENARAAAEAAAKNEQLALERAKALADAKVAELARIQADVRAPLEEDARRGSGAEQPAAPDERKPVGPLVALAPADGSVPGSKDDTARALQMELKRVGCGPARISDSWDGPAQRSLALFNKRAATTFDTSVASVETLNRVRSKTSRVCPLICEHGYKADGDSCTKIICKNGYQLTDDNSCEPIPRHARSRENSRENPRENPAVANAPERRAAPREASRDGPAGLPSGEATSGVKRADEARSAGNYRACMGPASGCYDRAIRNMTPEMARTWCSRKPTC